MPMVVFITDAENLLLANLHVHLGRNTGTIKLTPSYGITPKRWQFYRVSHILPNGDHSESRKEKNENENDNNEKTKTSIAYD
jgi:hypothetical protein